MPKKGWPLVFVFVIIVLIVLGYLTYWQIQLAQEVRLEEKSMVRPASFFLNVTQTKTVEYFDHTISVNYVSSSPTHKIEVTIDGETRTIEREPVDCETSCGEYWTVGNLNLKVEPVTWVENPQGQLVWSFETWDTTEIYFEANYVAKQPTAIGGKLL